MTAMGYEPVKLTFFSINDDGTLHYLTQAEVEAVAKKTAKKIKGGWVDTDFSPAFTNMELSFRKAGDMKAPLVTHRHIAFNLGDKAFKGSGLEKYLTAKGKIAAMTKAASYLIWNDGFSGIRDYLLANMPVDGFGFDRHRAEQGEEGRLHARPRTARSPARFSTKPTCPHQRRDGRDVEGAAEASAAVPLRLSRSRQTRSPDDHGAQGQRGSEEMKLAVLVAMLCAAVPVFADPVVEPTADDPGAPDETEPAPPPKKAARLTPADAARRATEADEGRWREQARQERGHDRRWQALADRDERRRRPRLGARRLQPRHRGHRDLHPRLLDERGRCVARSRARSSFKASHQNAMFIVPDAPASNDDSVN